MSLEHYSSKIYPHTDYDIIGRASIGTKLEGRYRSATLFDSYIDSDYSIIIERYQCYKLKALTLAKNHNGDIGTDVINEQDIRESRRFLNGIVIYIYPSENARLKSHYKLRIDMDEKGINQVVYLGIIPDEYQNLSRKLSATLSAIKELVERIKILEIYPPEIKQIIFNSLEVERQFINKTLLKEPGIPKSEKKRNYERNYRRITRHLDSYLPEIVSDNNEFNLETISDGIKEKTGLRLSTKTIEEIISKYQNDGKYPVIEIRPAVYILNQSYYHSNNNQI